MNEPLKLIVRDKKESAADKEKIRSAYDNFRYFLTLTVFRWISTFQKWMFPEKSPLPMTDPLKPTQRRRLVGSLNFTAIGKLSL